MKLLKDYLFLHRKSLIAFALLALIFCGVFALYRLPVESVLYALGLWMLAVLGLAGFDFSRFCVRHRTLEGMLKNIADGLDALPPASDCLEEDYQALLDALFRAKAGAATRADAAFRDMQDYSALWAHQIKTPIAAMRLLLQAHPSSESRALEGELFKIEQYVEMLLSYLRLEGSSRDLVMRACDLDEMLRQAIKKYARFFIDQKISLRYEPVRRQVLTDDKWFLFALEQILSNAVKYTPGGEIRIDLEGDWLVIADTGIGIAAEDLPRVFEKGYTGYNGRTGRKSTGLGLYLTGRALKMLRHEIQIQSAPNQGTRVRICLTRPDLSP